LKVALAVTAGGVVLLGVFPGGLLALAERSAATLIQLPSALFGLTAY